MSHPKIRLLDRAKETTNTTGSGTIALAGPVNGFVPLSGVGNGNSTYYTIEEGVTYEVGIGTYTSVGNALSRDQVFSSSNVDNARLNLQGSGTVFITYPADKAVVVSSGNLVGIGEVIDPEYQLHVSGTGSFDTVRTDLIVPDTNTNAITLSGNIIAQTGHLLRTSVTSIGLGAGYGLSGDNSIFIGTQAGTGFKNSNNIVIGSESYPVESASGNIPNSLVVGNRARAGSATTLIGHGNAGQIQGGAESVGVGYHVLLEASGARTVALGSYAGGSSPSTYSDSIAIGNNSKFAGSQGIAIGGYTNTSTTGDNSIAMGYSADAKAYGMAIGCHTMADDYTLVIGTGGSATDVMLSGYWGTRLSLLNAKFGINNTLPSAMADIRCSLFNVIGLNIDGATSQTAYLTRWRNASTSTLASVDKIGNITSHTASMVAPTGRFATSLSGLWQDQLSFIDNTIRVGTGCATLTNPQSVFIGYAAGSGIQSPCTHNIVIGNEAGYTSSGQYNTLIGSEAGENATGDYNIFLGSEAGLGASGTNYTICIGNEAGKNTPNTCTTNTIIGSQAGENMSGSYCVLLGPNAGQGLIGGAGVTDGSDRSVGLGLQALQDGSGYGSIGIGYNGGTKWSGILGIHLGWAAGYGGSGSHVVNIGGGAGVFNNGDYNINIGRDAGASCFGNNNIEIVTDGAATSILNGNSNKIHIENTIVGDTSNKKIAIGNVGAADVSPDATLEVKPNASTHVGFIVQGAASQTANLTEWQNSSESVVANVDPSGRIYASGGLLLETGIPAVTTNTIYNSGGVLFFNGSGINEVPPGGSTFTAGTGLLLVGNEFNTAKTGHFDAITFNNIAHIDTSGNATFANITTTGNLNVSGTLTYIDSTTVTIADKQLELASNSGTAAGNDAYVDDGGIVLKSTDGDKKWTWQSSPYGAWHSTEDITVAHDKHILAGPAGPGGAHIMKLNVLNRGNMVLGDPGPLTVPGNASGWLIMNKGFYHNGGVISGVRILDAQDMQVSSGDFRHLSISGTPMTFESVGGEAKLAGLGSLSVLPDGASAPLEIKGASNAYISFPDGTTQSTAPTGDIAIVSGLVVSNTGDIATVSGLTVTNASNIGTTGTTFVNATGTLVTNLASTGTTLAASIATNTGDIATVSGLTVTNASNIGTTGTTFVNATGTLVTNLASTGTTLAASIATNATNIATNTGDIATVSGLVTTYTAGSGLTLVGTQFNTADTGNFTKITFAQGAAAYSDNIRIGYRAGDLAPATSNTLTAIGSDAARNIKDNSIQTIAIGPGAGSTSSGDYNTLIGAGAGQQQEGDKNVSIGYYCGYNSVGNQNIFIGEDAGINVDGSNNIEIVTDSSTSPLDNQSNKINVEYTIIGDTSAKKLAIGNVSVSDISPDATVEIKPKEHTDIGLIVQGDTSHSANLTEWQNSSETVVASVAADGDIFTSGTVSATGGILINEDARILWSDNSVRIGTDAGDDAGTYNVAIGYEAGKSIGASSDHNNCIGYRAGEDMVNGSDYNQCLGYQAGRDADGDFNLFLGVHAGYNSAGTRNIYLGYQAGLEADPGSNNIEIITNSVYGVKSTLDGLSNKINIENTIMGDTAANKIVIGTGTTAQTANYSPAATLEIKPKEATDAALIVHSSGLSDVFSVSGTNVSISGRLLGPISAPVLQDTNATVNVALSSGNYHEVELAAAVTKVIFKDGIAGQRFMVRFSQPAGANYTIAWTNVDVDEGGTGGTVSWAAGGTAPTMTATNGKADTYGFIQRSATTFDGFVVGQNI